MLISENRIGTGIVNVYSRIPAKLAMAVATLDVVTLNGNLLNIAADKSKQIG
jgi:alkanesulfonate monooxygenase SsuD/methylene tetrahydromethanopterin reductase-like flavin-dependent oxidoreductase (luciferase family)